MVPDAETLSDERRADLRTPVVGLVAWLAALGALHLPWGVTGAGWLVAVAAVGVVAARGRLRPEHLAWLAVLVAVGGATLLRAESVEAGPLGPLAAEQATAEVRFRLTGDPVVRDGRFSDYVLVRARALEVTARGRHWTLRQPVLVLAPTSWRAVHLGDTVRAGVRLAPATGRDLAAVLSARGSPEVVERRGRVLAATDRVRAGIRDAAAGGPAGARDLVPALVDGDDAGMSESTQAEFRTTGLTHLLAVSGTNLTLVVGALLVAARACGVQARGLAVVGAIGVVGFVLLARPEPSVLRAAAMGTVALVGLGSNGRERGTRALGVAVLGLMLLDPGLAGQVGFALSALATAGILFLAPGWRDALGRWLPRWVAEAVAVPLAAQLACTPVVAAISGQVSLVAVAANLVAAPAVAPATVLGLAGGVASAVWPPLGRPLGFVASWCAQWILVVAHQGAALPTAAVGWPTSPGALLLLTLLCGWLAMVAAPVLARRRWTAGLGALAVVVVLVPLPTPGWPPPGWVMVACDVGQGDGLVLAAGPGAGVVVDAGPDPRLMDACLRRLGVRRVPLVVLTHFHADHVDGLAGVLHGRRVGEIEVTSVAEPFAGVRRVRALADRAGVPVRIAAPGESRQVGPLRWEVLAPSGPTPADSESPPNDASVVLYVRTRGVRLLLMGDEETGSQERLAAAAPGLRADVIKVAHHGSAKQDPDLLRSLGARLAVVSVGADNDYGHPAPRTLLLLRGAGMRVARTDTDGDVAVTARSDGVHVRTRLPAVRPR